MKIIRTCAIIMAILVGIFYGLYKSGNLKLLNENENINEKPRFYGIVSKLDDSFNFDFDLFNTTEEHNLELKQGDILDVDIEVIQGKIDLVISRDNIDKIYQANDAQTSNFKLNINKDGIYTITLKGKNAKGKVYIDKENITTDEETN